MSDDKPEWAKRNDEIHKGLMEAGDALKEKDTPLSVEDLADPVPGIAQAEEERLVRNLFARIRETEIEVHDPDFVTDPESVTSDDVPERYIERYGVGWDSVVCDEAEITRVNLTGGNQFSWSDGLGHLEIHAGDGTAHGKYLCKEYGSETSWSALILRSYGLRPVELGALPGKMLPVVSRSSGDGWTTLDKATVAYRAALAGVEHVRLEATP